jgi:hypothetical protein
MTRSADSVTESVKSGALGLRALAVETGKAGAELTAHAVEIAERKLAEGTDEFSKKSRRTRKNFAKNTKTPLKELQKSSVATRDETVARAAELRAPGRKAKQAAILAAKSVGGSKRNGKKNFKAAKRDFRAAVAESKSAVKGERLQRRRWPWLIAIVAAAGAAVYARRSRQAPQVEALPPETPPATPVTKPVAADKPVPAEKPVSAEKHLAAEKPVAAPTPPKAAAKPSPTPHNGQKAPSTPGSQRQN